MTQMLRRFFFYIFTAFILYFSFLMLELTIPYFSFDYDVDFLLTKQNVLHHLYWRIAFYTHISFSLLVLITGAFQFSRYLIFQKPAVHRFLGKTYVFIVLLISAPSGFVMALHANGGIWAKTSFATTSLLWWYFTWSAYRKARRKQFKPHLEDMYRSYSLTLSAITLRLYVVLLPFISDLHGKEMYVTVAWLSWVPNLLCAEFLLRRQKLLN